MGFHLTAEVGSAYSNSSVSWIGAKKRNQLEFYVAQICQYNSIYKLGNTMGTLMQSDQMQIQCFAYT